MSYPLTRILEKPPGLGPTLPDRILTLSSCLTEFFPDAWAIEWTSYPEADRIAAAAKLGIAQHALPALIRYATMAMCRSANFRFSKVSRPPIARTTSTTQRSLRRNASRFCST